MSATPAAKEPQRKAAPSAKAAGPRKKTRRSGAARSKAAPAAKGAASAVARPAVSSKKAGVVEKGRSVSGTRTTTRRLRVRKDLRGVPAPSGAEWPAVGEQERVGAAKYGARPAARGGFDEQRFLFPRNYEVNRVRLVVRDPEWLFAYWDVNPRAFEGIRREMGERAMALSRLTLKVADPDGSHVQVILLPYGVRSWYVRIDPSRTRYFAELGITLPSGQFRGIASSNVVDVPRVGPSPQAAARSIAFHEAWTAMGQLPTGVGEAASSPSGDGDWIDPGTSIRPGPVPSPADLSGASDLFRR